MWQSTRVRVEWRSKQKQSKSHSLFGTGKCSQHSKSCPHRSCIVGILPHWQMLTIAWKRSALHGTMLLTFELQHWVHFIRLETPKLVGCPIKTLLQIYNTSLPRVFLDPFSISSFTIPPAAVKIQQLGAKIMSPADRKLR